MAVTVLFTMKEGAKAPLYKTTGAAGADICAFVERSVVIRPMERALIHTGIHIELPEGYECQVRPRSGLALNHGITVLNSPGTIDSDYRGEIGIVLINLGAEPFIVENGDRIAQLVVAPVNQCSFTMVESLSNTNRGISGYGSTGRN